MSKKPIYSQVELYEKGKIRSYKEDAKIAAFLLGGIGTGNVSLGSRGEFRDWEIFNWPGKGTFLPFSFFAIWAKPEDGPSVAKILESKVQPPYHKSHGFLNGELAGLPRFEKSSMTGKQPFVTIDFEDRDVPVKVQLEAFTPLIPLHADDSGIPGAVLRYKVYNPTPKPVEVSVVGSLANVVGFDGYDVFNNVKLVDEVKNEYRKDGDVAGLYYTAVNLRDDHFKYGSMSLMTTNGNVIARPTWLHGQWTDNAQDFWDDFKDDGKLDDVREITGAGCDLLDHYNFSFLNLKEKVGSLGSYDTIAPGEEKTFEFILSWHFPNRPKGWIEFDEDLERYRSGQFESIKNYYATKFASAWEAGKYLADHMGRLEQGSRAFQEALFGSTLPSYVIDAVASNITSLKSHCCFRIEDGNFLGWEGIRDYVGCGQGNVNHVWNYAQTVAFLFPELEQTMRRVEFNLETSEAGEMPFRARQVLGQEKWNMIPACDGQLGSVVRLFREWKLSGDDSFLQEIWDKAVLALDYAMTEWDTDGDCVLDGKMHVTYDIEFYGPNAMTNSIFLAALKAGAEMAEAMGDPTRAAKYRTAFEAGAARMDQLLWNGEYYIQKLDDVDEYRYQYGEGCLSDQLLGQFMAHTAGLGYVLPKEHVKTALKSIYEYNFKNRLDEVESVQRTYALNDESGLTLCSWPRGARPRFPFAYCDEVWTGVEYQVAVNMIYEGLMDEALSIVKSVRDRYDGYRRNPWSEIEAGHHYIRAMASWGLINAISGFECDLAKGTMSFEPKLSPQHFRTFWINGKAWGTYEQRIDPQTGEVKTDLAVLYGSLDGISLKPNLQEIRD
ncbi:GH116 family glycosyl-hydrolase [Paenibacillaceae bacterium WGS1546]|uniref:GH116 family glycosyl-hydrolase n=1 Tax=Cohnella sp. WGS1546 TaxID=3366810 RepID=UPI00372D4240